MAVSQALGRLTVRQEWFDPLIRTAIWDPDPSFNRQLIEPALVAFGRRRVQVAILDFLRAGTDPERAGAARVWYRTHLRIRQPDGGSARGRDVPADDDAGTDDAGTDDAGVDLRRQWRDTALGVFLTTEDLDVRRCILPGLDLRIGHYPEELHEAVTQAIALARAHPDDYLRHRVEHQV